MLCKCMFPRASLLKIWHELLGLIPLTLWMSSSSSSPFIVLLSKSSPRDTILMLAIQSTGHATKHRALIGPSHSFLLDASSPVHNRKNNCLPKKDRFGLLLSYKFGAKTGQTGSRHKLWPEISYSLNLQVNHNSYLLPCQSGPLSLWRRMLTLLKLWHPGLLQKRFHRTYLIGKTPETVFSRGEHSHSHTCLFLVGGKPVSTLQPL